MPRATTRQWVGDAVATCKCSDCKECVAKRKEALAELLAWDEEIHISQGANHSEYPKSWKQLNDVLKQAERDLWQHLDWLEDAKARRGGWGTSWYRESIRRISREIAEVEQWLDTYVKKAARRLVD